VRSHIFKRGASRSSSGWLAFGRRGCGGHVTDNQSVHDIVTRPMASLTPSLRQGPPAPLLRACWRPPRRAAHLARTIPGDTWRHRRRRSRPRRSPLSTVEASQIARLRQLPHVPPDRWHQLCACHGRPGTRGARPVCDLRWALVGVRRACVPQFALIWKRPCHNLRKALGAPTWGLLCVHSCNCKGNFMVKIAKTARRCRWRVPVHQHSASPGRWQGRHSVGLCSCDLDGGHFGAGDHRSPNHASGH